MFTSVWEHSQRLHTKILQIQCSFWGMGLLVYEWSDPTINNFPLRNSPKHDLATAVCIIVNNWSNFFFFYTAMRNMKIARLPQWRPVLSLWLNVWYPVYQVGQKGKLPGRDQIRIKHINEGPSHVWTLGFSFWRPVFYLEPFLNVAYRRGMFMERSQFQNSGTCSRPLHSVGAGGCCKNCYTVCVMSLWYPL